jgi:hypothetical protein
MKKGAIGLSINTLVVVIISIVILSGGITLLYKFIGGAEDIKATLDQRTQDELERLLVGQGKKVALPLHVAEIPRGESHLFGLGISNTKDNKDNFAIGIKLSKVVDEFEEDITDQVSTDTVEEWVFYNTGAISLDSGENHKESLLVNIPKNAVKGQYIFTVSVVSSSGDSYGNPQKFYVTVN